MSCDNSTTSGIVIGYGCNTGASGSDADCYPTSDRHGVYGEGCLRAICLKTN